MEQLQKSLGYVFKQQSLLIQALTHSSFTHEKSADAISCNERLEFLGDAVLEVTVSDLLYHRYPAISEGELTKKRASLVCEPSLSQVAKGVNLGALLLLGRGEDVSGGRERDSLLSDAMEAVFGAVYLDGGMENARQVIIKLIEPMMKKSSAMQDYKSALQEFLQKKSNEPVEYEIVNEKGLPHQKIFTAQVSHEGRKLGLGTGRNKKEAEQNAAMEAMKKLN